MGKSPIWMRKLTVSMTMFHSYVTNYQRVTAENQSQTWSFWNNSWPKSAYDFFQSIPGIQWAFPKTHWLFQVYRDVWVALQGGLRQLEVLQWWVRVEDHVERFVPVGAWIVWRISHFPFQDPFERVIFNLFPGTKWTAPYRTQSARKDEAHWKVIQVYVRRAIQDLIGTISDW